MYGSKTAFLILFCFVCSLAYSQPDQDLVSDGIENGVTLHFELVKNRYYEGESIVLRYTKSSTTTTFRDWSSLDMLNCINILDEQGKQLGAARTFINQENAALSSYSSKLELTGSYQNVKFNGPDNQFVHIKPGRYQIQYLCSPPMPPLVFIVESNPDSLQEAWDKYSSIEVMYQGRQSLGLSGEEVLEQTAELTRYFINLPKGHRFRKEALRAGLVSFGFNRASWAQQDSINCLEILQAYSSESDFSTQNTLEMAKYTIFKNLRGAERIAKITEYADSLDDPDAMEALEKVINGIRDHNQRE